LAFWPFHAFLPRKPGNFIDRTIDMHYSGTVPPTLGVGERSQYRSFQVSRSFLRLASRSLGLLLMLSGMSGVAMAVVAPEVDPASATSALALLVGAAMLARDRFRRL
jgi:hypothetical protein